MGSCVEHLCALQVKLDVDTFCSGPVRAPLAHIRARPAGLGRARRFCVHANLVLAAEGGLKSPNAFFMDCDSGACAAHEYAHVLLAAASRGAGRASAFGLLLLSFALASSRSWQRVMRSC